jgi:hypothetical protein
MPTGSVWSAIFPSCGAPVSFAPLCSVRACCPRGNPAGLAGVPVPMLDFSVFGVLAGGSFQNAVNPNAQLSGVAAALPYAAFATPIGRSHWVTSAAFTPENQMRAIGTTTTIRGLPESLTGISARRAGSLPSAPRPQFRPQVVGGGPPVWSTTRTSWTQSVTLSARVKF